MFIGGAIASGKHVVSAIVYGTTGYVISFLLAHK